MGDESTRRLYVSNLPADIRDEEVRMVFGTYGTVADVHLLQPQGPTRVGFVTYETSEAAGTSIQVLNNVYKFRPEAPEAIRVSIAKPRGSGAPKGDGKGFGGGGGFGPPGYGKGGPPGYDQWGGKGGGPGYDQWGGKGGYDQWGKGGPPGYDQWGKGGGPQWGGKGGYGGPGPQGPPGGYGGPPGKGGPSYAEVPGPKIFVGNLPGDIQKETLEKVFSTYGHINDVNILAGKSQSGQSCGFITFNTQEEAQGAIAAMAQGYEIRPGEGNILVKFAGQGRTGGPPGHSEVPGPKIFVGNLPADIQKETVQQVFATYGSVVDINVLQGRAKNGQSLAFITYSAQPEAESAIASMSSGYEIRPGEGPIVVKYADARQVGGAGGPDSGYGKAMDGGKGGYGGGYAPY